MKILIIAGLIALSGCSLLTKQETTASNIPSAETLTWACKQGALQTPPIRAGACDDFDTVQAGCLALTNQPLVPAQALLACTAGGYVISGSYTRL